MRKPSAVHLAPSQEPPDIAQYMFHGDMQCVMLCSGSAINYTLPHGHRLAVPKQEKS
jgi:hypothetical protein